MENQKRWYIIQTYSGLENSVKEDLERRIESMKMQDFIFQCLIPEETVTEVKADGTKKEKVKKMYPGYLFVEMIVTDESWFVVRNTPKVTGFLGSSGGGTKPVPLPKEEMDQVLEQIGMLVRPVFDINIGEKVKVIGGSFDGYIGEVININFEKEIVTISIDMFGRKTPADFDFKHIERA